MVLAESNCAEHGHQFAAHEGRRVFIHDQVMDDYRCLHVVHMFAVRTTHQHDLVIVIAGHTKTRAATKEVAATIQCSGPPNVLEVEVRADFHQRTGRVHLVLSTDLRRLDTFATDERLT